MTVILGGNRFIDCQSIFSFKGQSMVRVLLDPLRVQIDPPPDLPAIPHEGQKPLGLREVATDRSYALFRGDRAVAIATLLDADEVHLTLDLRPLGIIIYDDADGLHIGDNLFSKNTVQGVGSAISLG